MMRMDPDTQLLVTTINPLEKEVLGDQGKDGYIHVQNKPAV